MRILQKVREEHESTNNWTQDGKILLWDSVIDRIKLYLYTAWKVSVFEVFLVHIFSYSDENTD